MANRVDLFAHHSCSDCSDSKETDEIQKCYVEQASRQQLFREQLNEAARVSQWNEEAVERLPEVFAGKSDADAAAAKARMKGLFEEIGLLKMELEWLKRKSWRARALTSAAA